MTGPSPSRRALWGRKILKGLFLYALFPVLCLIFLSQPIGDAACASEPAPFWILLAALGAVALNEAVYFLFHRKCPSLLVFAWGLFCLFLVLSVVYVALPGEDDRLSTLAVIGGVIVLAFLFLLSFWFAARRSRPAHVAAVGLWIIIAALAVLMAYQVIRDFESGNVTRDTWITLAMLIALLPAACCRRILAASRGAKARRRATGQAAGRIVQLVGETHLDRDDDAVTRYHARVQYTVEDVLYETNAEISRWTIVKFGRPAFIGRKIPVRYDPENPADAFTNRIDRHLFDGDRQEETEQEAPDQEETNPDR